MPTSEEKFEKINSLEPIAVNIGKKVEVQAHILAKGANRHYTVSIKGAELKKTLVAEKLTEEKYKTFDAAEYYGKKRAEEIVRNLEALKPVKFDKEAAYASAQSEAKRGKEPVVVLKYDLGGIELFQVRPRSEMELENIFNLVASCKPGEAVKDLDEKLQSKNKEFSLEV